MDLGLSGDLKDFHHQLMEFVQQEVIPLDTSSSQKSRKGLRHWQQPLTVAHHHAETQFASLQRHFSFHKGAETLPRFARIHFGTRWRF